MSINEINSWNIGSCDVAVSRHQQCFLIALILRLKKTKQLKSVYIAPVCERR